ncbi:MAG: glycoside hydrolase family 3 C-terminal domain-containing protein [Bacteroidales bacterium]|nr:glycoside hydrolase family 3 C-terminal domain-containing protein [Bacteroidales bacterium]
MKKTALILAGICLIIAGMSCSVKENTGPDKAIYEKVDSIMSLMTLEEKAGQMLNLGLAALLEGPFFTFRDTLIFDTAKVNSLLVKHGAGSVQNLGTYPLTPEEWRYYIGYIQNVVKGQTRLKIPVLYGIDAVHGANYTAGSVLTPHQINIAASFDTSLARIAGEITAYEMKASAIPWNYSPNLDVARNPLWGRIYETFGEDTYVTTMMGKSMIEGMMGNDPAAYDKVIASAKHFIGYGAMVTGKDRSFVMMPEHYIRQILLPPFEEAIKSGLLSIMVSSSSLNGTPSHIDHYFLTKVLKEELGFKGVVITDWGDIDNLVNNHRVAKNEREAVKMSVLAGIDICMEPYDASFSEHLIDLVKSGEVPQSRVDDAVRRILYVKYKSGIFDDMLFEKHSYDKFASKEFDSLSLQAARESITLLKNANNILPLAKNKKVLVTGVAGNSINYLNNGWSRTWAGEDTAYNDKQKHTILQAIKAEIGSQNVKFVQGTGYTNEINIDEAVNNARQADIIIACVGEKPATEVPSNIEDLELPDAQIKLVEKLAATGKPVILVMTQGRPRIIRKIEPLVQAVVMAYVPGNEGGIAISDIIFGNANPSGKLPYTYPRYSGSIIMYDHQRENDFGFMAYRPQYEFGYGLSYTTFEYGDIKLDSDSVKSGNTINCSIDVKNTGKLAGKEAVLLFVTDEYASVCPVVKQLKRFTKIYLEPGETKTVTFKLELKDLMFVSSNNKRVYEPGSFKISIGNKEAGFYLYE